MQESFFHSEKLLMPFFFYSFFASVILSKIVLRKKEKEVIKMAKNNKQTSKTVASKASKILKDGRYSKDSKSVAGSALAQTKPGKKK